MRSISLALLLCSCDRDKDGAPPAPRTGDGLLAEGCPDPGEASARVIGLDQTLPGETAVGSRGDFLLLNDQAAYVITRPDAGSTYYYYGGIVADAVPLAGCAPAGEDKLDEVGIVLGQLDLGEWEQSVLRAFEGQSAEVLNDGSDGGAAIVRVTGVDAPHWLVEYTLIRELADDGGKARSEPFGVDITVDYILEPDSPVLEAQITITNTGDERLSLITASLMSVGETLDLFGYSSQNLSLGGFSLGYGVPWQVATDGAGALAYGVLDGNLGTMSISGMEVLADVTQALDAPIALNPGQSASRSFFLSVGASDGPSATAPLAERNPEPLPAGELTLTEITGVVQGPDGPVEDAAVTLQAASDDAGWGDLDRAFTGTDGSFTLYAPVFAEAWSWRVVASADGRDDAEAVELSPGEGELTLEIGAAGALQYTITDGEGQPAPARLRLSREDGETVNLWLADHGEAAVPPGTWSYTATRGYEYAIETGTLTVPEGGAASLEISLARLLDTAGWMSVDTHVHTSGSTDSDVDQAEQLLHAAAHGLEIVVHTEHENIVETRTIPADAGLDAWVNNVIGEEVTASSPEHLTMFPVEPDGSIRGGIVEWYEQDLDQIFGAMRERSGGGVNLLNHPSYLDTIGWDRLSAAPTLDDPTLLGLEEGAALWSWDMDGMEVMNGHASPFLDGNARFDNWSSMINAGHPLVAVGCSDDHGGDEVGFPRSYFASGTDEPSELDLDELVGAFQGGALLASAGAFATVTVNGEAGLGDTVTDTDGEISLALSVQAIPEIDVTHAIVFVNCDEVLALAATDPGGVLKLDETVELSLEADSWVSVAAFGANLLPAGLPQYDPTTTPRVLTSPIYIDIDGDGQSSPPGGRECSYLLQSP